MRYFITLYYILTFGVSETMIDEIFSGNKDYLTKCLTKIKQLNQMDPNLFSAQDQQDLLSIQPLLRFKIRAIGNYIKNRFQGQGGSGFFFDLFKSLYF